jgi:Holliday junction resolvase RusA-like endonuclease
MSKCDLMATLSHPPSVNRRWRATGGGARWFLTDAARAWGDAAILALRGAGWRPLPPAPHYWIGLHIELSTCRTDVDNALKATLDAVAGALSVDDATVGALTVLKRNVHRRADQGLLIRACIRSLADMSEYNEWTARWSTGDTGPQTSSRVGGRG